MNYVGPERRQYLLLVTKNTEYHVRGSTCVAVRDRKTGQWLHEHEAVGCGLLFGLRQHGGGSWSVNFDHPELGDKLCFAPDLVTGPVHHIERPDRRDHRHYVSAQAA